MSNYSIQLGHQDTRADGEDLALTPYLFLVNTKDLNTTKVIGFGICWIYFSIYMAVGYNVPKNLRGFNNHNKNKHI